MVGMVSLSLPTIPVVGEDFVGNAEPLLYVRWHERVYDKDDQGDDVWFHERRELTLRGQDMKKEMASSSTGSHFFHQLVYRYEQERAKQTQPKNKWTENDGLKLYPTFEWTSEGDLLLNTTNVDYKRQVAHVSWGKSLQTRLLQQSGGGLDGAQGAFEFELDTYVDRLSSRMGVRERHFNTRLRQRGNLIPDENITEALQDGLRRAVNQVLATTPNLHDQDRLYFTLSSDRLHNNFQGWGLCAGEWREGGERLDALFDRLAQALNSNEQFEMDDSFQLSITQVHHAPQGTGKPHRGKPGHPTMEILTSNKRSVIRIQNRDELCCARALVVAQARVDQHPKEKAIQRGKGPLQRTLVLELHHEAKVPLGPCSYDALTKFSAAPSLANYQIILVDAHRSFHITTFGGTQDKQLILLHHQGHYDVITRLPGFFGSSYVCAHCWKPYNTEGGHRCNKKRVCGACRQKECPDFRAAYPRGLKATQRCHTCHRDFFGDTCFQTHLAVDHAGKPATSPQTTICFLRRRCPSCRKQDVGVERIQRHQCWHIDCPSCHEYVDAQTHLCFIQRAPKPQEEKKKRKKKRQRGPRTKRGAAAAGLQTPNAPE